MKNNFTSINLHSISSDSWVDYEEYSFGRNDWNNWGKDNLYPNKIIQLYDQSGLHQSITKGISQMIAGSGIVELNSVYNPFLTTPNLDENLHSIVSKLSFDLKLFGGFALHIVKSKVNKSKIAQIYHIPLQNLRAKVEMNRVVGYYYSEDWSKRRGKKVFYTKYSLNNIQDSSIIWVNSYTPSLNPFYPKPDYNGGIKYVQLESSIANYQLNLVNNGMVGTMHISFKNGTPSQEESDVIRRRIEQELTGTDNPMKVLITYTDDPAKAVDIKPIASPDADKQYISIQEQVIQNIIISHRINPSLIGTYVKSNFGVGDILKDYEVFQTMTIDPYQKLIETTLSNLFKSSGIESNLSIEELRPIVLEDATKNNVPNV